MKRTDTATEADVVRLYESGVPVPRICDQLGVKASTAYLILNRWGIIRRGASECHRKYTANHEFFDRIESPCSAYLLGFWTADGYVSRGSVGVQLARRDVSHLHAIRRAMRSDHKLTEHGSCFRLEIKSPQLIEGLRRAGVTERKTFTVTPWDGPADLMPHYWRGVVDGDGYLGIGCDHGSTVYSLELTGNRAMCDGFLSFVRDVVEDEVGAVRPMRSVFRTRLKGVGSMQRLVRCLYPPGEYLALGRKRAVAEKCLTAEPKQARKSFTRGCQRV